MNEVIKAIKDRRSIRHYTEKQVTDEELGIVIEAGILAPSARNRQQRQITVVQNTALLDEMAAEINEKLGDREEAYHVFHHAPTVIVISAKEDATYIGEDIGILVENMCLAAYSIGLGTCILGLPQALFKSPEGEKYIKIMNIPEGYKPVLSVTLGNTTKLNITEKPRNHDIVNFIK